MNDKIVLICLALGVVAATQQETISRFQPGLNSDNGGLGVYNGKATTINKHPYVASLVYEGVRLCAATIISKNWVLVTADCVYGQDPSSYTIVSGTNDGLFNGTVHTLQKVVVHPSFVSKELLNNIAVLKIKGSFKWDEKTRPIKLPNKEIADNTVMSVAGYGETSTSHPSITLRQGRMKWLPKTTCASILSGIEFPDILACAYNKGKTTLCEGDWSDALVKGEYVYGLFVGVVKKWFCSSKALPNVFTDVYPFSGWVKNTTGITY